MQINESVIESIIHGLIRMELPEIEIIDVEISTPVVLDENEGVFEIPARIKLKKEMIKEKKEKNDKEK